MLWILVNHMSDNVSLLFAHWKAQNQICDANLALKWTSIITFSDPLDCLSAPFYLGYLPLKPCLPPLLNLHRTNALHVAAEWPRSGREMGPPWGAIAWEARRSQTWRCSLCFVLWDISRYVNSSGTFWKVWPFERPAESLHGSLWSSSQCSDVSYHSALLISIPAPLPFFLTLIASGFCLWSKMSVPWSILHAVLSWELGLRQM